MKGIIIYGNPMWGDNERATYCEFINEASFDVTQYAPKTIISSLKGETSKLSKTVCSKDDTYDFETGALIALMKMCGLEKSAKAYAEIFDDTAYGDALKERDRLDRLLREAKEVINTKARFIKEKNEEIEKLKEEKEQIIVAKSILNNKLIEENSNLNYIKSCNESTIKSLENTRDLLINKNNELIEENKELKKNIDELFESEQHSKSVLGRVYFEKHRLEEEVEKLKLDCEKLQHGYVDSDNVPSGHWDGDILDIVFLPGRACGKQYKTLVELFKKIDQKKVDAAYKEAYNTTLPVWQKEALRQAYEIHKESKEKTELPRTLDINGTVYRKSIQIKDFGEQINKLTVDSLVEQSRAFTRKCVDEWLYGPLTKREEMWKKIFDLHKESDVIIKVKKEDIITFLHEIENKIPEITWASCVKIFETKYTIKDIFKELEGCDTPYEICFRLWKVNKLSYSSDQYIYPSYKFKHIDYLPPMRWDLFEKGRLAVKVNYDNYKEFYEACEKELGKRPVTAVFTEDFTVSICKKDGLFEIFSIEDQKKTGRKIVDWEDVR